jgi:signal transduction histidine kinase
MAAAIAPNARNLAIVLGMIGGCAGSIHLTKTGHGPADVLRWILVIAAVTLFSYYGAARYLRVWLRIQASIRKLTLALSETAANLVLLRDEAQIIEAVFRVLEAQGFTASFEPEGNAVASAAPNGGQLSSGRLLVPLFMEERFFGMLHIQGASMNDAEAGALELFARHVGGALANVQHHRRALARLDELHALQGELLERERLAVLGEAAAVVAHEVRNPLGAILNSTALLKRSARAEPEREILRMIEEESTRLDGLVHDLLHLARPLEPQLIPLDLSELCDRIARCLRQQPLFARVRLYVCTQADLPLVLADAGLIQVLVENLLRNAAQASPPDGAVHLKVESVDGGVRLSVDDEGSGISEENLPKIFRPFFTTRVTGTGLGLSLVKRIADAHAIPVRVSRTSARGTCFELEFKDGPERSWRPGRRPPSSLVSPAGST